MKKLSRVGLIAGTLTMAAAGAQAQYAKLDAALSDLLDSVQPRSASQAAQTSASELRSTVLDSGSIDSFGRILVDIYLDGTVSPQLFQAQLVALGANVTGVNPHFQSGAISAFVPVSSIAAIATSGGLNVMRMTRKPQRNVGAVNSQGTTVMRSNTANANGFKGTGITVGVLSDSYDGSPTSFTSIRAANDIASGDLRVPKFVIDQVDPDNTDEGRAMMQIVQDVAPLADLCFATAFTGEAAFAANIRTLRTNAACRADVIVDDVFYFDEPFFSDGQVAQAVDDVVNSTTLAGRKVSYFSSAGNQGGAGGRGGSVDVPNAAFGTATGLGNINLASAATCTSSPSTGSTKADFAGGWLTFPSTGNTVLPVNYNSAGSTLIMQWDDRFYAGQVTTDLNWYLFNSAGACVFTFAANNFSTDNGLEIVALNGGPSGAYRVMVGRTSAGTKLATRVRMVNLGGWGGATFPAASGPSTFGHSAAAGANSVAAYRYTSPASQQSPFIPAFELFSSPGPVTIAFDAAGARLPVAETRKKPDIAAPDGGNTTFFFPGSDFEGDGRPNFFGTSAAAPHAAGVAALMLQKAGGPGMLTPKQVKSILQTTTPARVTPFVGGAPVRTWSIFDGFGLIDAVNALAKLP